MVPSGGMELSQQESFDLLLGFITDAKRVQAALVVPSTGTRAFVDGVVRASQSEKLIQVIEREQDPRSPSLAFNPFEAVLCRYGDERVLPETVGHVFKNEFSCAMTLKFADDSVVALFELLPE